MLFIDNKYTRWYYNIINRAIARPKPNTYTERHHIIPKSLGGSNSKQNLVDLTAREHFVCHCLLVKMTTGVSKVKMSYAAFCLCNLKNKDTTLRHTPNSWTFSKLREEYAKSVKKTLAGRTRSIESRQKQSATTTGRQLNPEHKKNVSAANISRNIANRGKPAWNKGLRLSSYGVPKTEEHKANMRKPKPLLECPHCHQVGGSSQMKRWHYDNCKTKQLLVV